MVSRRQHISLPGTFGLLTVLTVWVVCIGLPSTAEAQDVRLPRVGQQYFSVGMMLQPGFVHDPTYPTTESPTGEEWNRLTPTAAGVAQFGLHQIITRNFMMGAEADLGMQWLDEHTAAPSGQSSSETVLTWQIGLLGRWLPFGEQAGWHLGFGPSLYRAYLEDGAIQMLGLNLRAGKFLWQAEKSFVLMEIGYVFPALQGLDKPPNFSNEPRNDAPSDWTFHRFGFSVQYGF